MSSRVATKARLEAEKIEASIFELPARVQEELVILYRVQPSDSEHYKQLFLAPLWTYCTYGRSIDPEAVHDNFVGTYIRVILKDVAPVIFRDGQAKLAIAELLVEIRGMQQQVGAVQSHAEINSQQARGDHGDRRGEISVMKENNSLAAVAQTKKRAYLSVFDYSLVQHAYKILLLKARRIHEKYTLDESRAEKPSLLMQEMKS